MGEVDGHDPFLGDNYVGKTCLDLFEPDSIRDHNMPVPAYWRHAKKFFTGRIADQIKQNKLYGHRDLICYEFYFHWVGKRIDLEIPFSGCVSSQSAVAVLVVLVVTTLLTVTI